MNPDTDARVKGKTSTKKCRIDEISIDTIAKLETVLNNEINSINACRFVPVFLNNVRSQALVDSGNSAGCCISAAFAKRIGLSVNDIQSMPTQIGTAKKGASLTCLGITKKPVELRFAGTEFCYKFKPFVLQELSSDINLSIHFLERHSIDQLHSCQALRIKGHLVQMYGKGDPRTDIQELDPKFHKNMNTYVAVDTVIPAMSAKCIKLRVPRLETLVWSGGSGILSAESQFTDKYDILPAHHAIVKVDSKGQTLSTVLNNSAEDVLVKRGSRFGTFEGVQLDKSNREPKLLKWSSEKIIEVFKIKESAIKDDPVLIKQFVEMIKQFGDLFSDDEDNYGNTALVKHTINTGNAKPIRQKIRPLNPAVEKQLDAQIAKWLEKDIIEESNSPWSSRLVPVPKKNGKLRWCVDYRQLNKVTIKDAFPLPNIEESLTRMAKCSVFSALDGTGAYHAVHIDEADREKTAFSCHSGTYHFKRLPFGLCNAPATFSRLVMKALMGLDRKYYAPFLDDVAIFSKSNTEHLEHLCKVLNAQRNAGLTLQPKKCQFFRNKIDFLGHTISRKGIETNKEFVSVIESWPIPTNISDLRTFLGKTGYYRKFIKDYAKIACPLLNMITKESTAQAMKKVTLKLNEDQVRAFKTLKQCLLQAPILSFADFSSDKPLILDTDWSKDPGAIGAVLSQVQDGKERVICYGAKKLSQAERNYSSNKGELLAAIHFMKLWKFFLWPRKFILRTDHQALKWIYTMEKPPGLIMRWLETLANFDFTPEFRHGKSHANADSLSRATHVQAINAMDAPDTEPNTTDLNAKYHQAMRDDENLAKVEMWLRTNQLPTKEMMRRKNSVIKKYKALAKRLHIKDGRIYLKWRDETGQEIDRLCLPQQLQQQVFQHYHGKVHLGTNRTAQLMRSRFYFPAMEKAIRQSVQSCEVCQAREGPNKPQRHTHVPVMSDQPWKKISIDLVGPLPKSSRGNTQLLTVKCCFTRWLEAVPVADTSAKNIGSQKPSTQTGAHNLTRTSSERFAKCWGSRRLTRPLTIRSRTQSSVPTGTSRGRSEQWLTNQGTGRISCQ